MHDVGKIARVSEKAFAALQVRIRWWSWQGGQHSTDLFPFVFISDGAICALLPAQ